MKNKENRKKSDIEKSLKRNFLSIFSIAILGVISSGILYFTFSESEHALQKINHPEIDLPLDHPEETFPYAIKRDATFFQSLREFDIPPQTIFEIVEATKPVYDLSRLPRGLRYQLHFEDQNDPRAMTYLEDLNLTNKDSSREINDQKSKEKIFASTQNPSESKSNARSIASDSDENDILKTIPQDQKMLSGLSLRISSVERIHVRNQEGRWIAQKVTEKVDIKTTSFSGTVSSSLWESAQKVNMDPNLISELADIFGWEVDFSREVQPNDKWRLVVEQKFVKGKPIGWGSILVAEYVNNEESHQAILYRSNGEDLGYFSPDGTSLRKVFLKSPIQYRRISSRFSRHRFHPVLGISRPHLGVDYAASRGTPVRSIGDGVILMAGRKGGAGNMIKIRHNATYQTAYKHLNGFAKGIRKNVKVKQGQVIGYVGTTGLSTGPHLHFEFYKNGGYVDPIKQKSDPADPVSKELMADFRSKAETLLSTLPPWETLEANLSSYSKEEVHN